jgi:hypothetical protein
LSKVVFGKLLSFLKEVNIQKESLKMSIEALKKYLSENVKHLEPRKHLPQDMINPESFKAQQEQYLSVGGRQPQIRERIAQLIKEIPEFSIYDHGWVEIPYSGFALTSKYVAIFLIGQVIKYGPEKAVNHLVKFAKERNHKSLEILVMGGVNVKDEIELFDGVKIIPISQIPDSAIKDLMLDIPYYLPGHDLRQLENNQSLHLQGSLAALIRPCKIHFLENAPKNKWEPHFQNDERTFLSDILLCLSLTCGAPYRPLRHWTHLDPNIPGSYNQGQINYSPDIVARVFKWLDNTPVQELKSLYLAFSKLSDKEKDHLVIPVARLSNAFLRGGKIDKAIELGIAIESLLGGKAGSEIAFQISLRAALFEESDREKTFSDFKKMYSIRSKAVHEGIIPNKYKKEFDSLFVRCHSKCLTIIKRMILSNQVNMSENDWKNFVLKNSKNIDDE